MSLLIETLSESVEALVGAFFSSLILLVVRGPWVTAE